jgi:hypothetical protein
MGNGGGCTNVIGRNFEPLAPKISKNACLKKKKEKTKEKENLIASPRSTPPGLFFFYSS